MSEFISVKGRKALEKVADWLERGAPHVDVNGRSLDNFNMNFAVMTGGCGTSCCVAGAVVQFEGLGVLREDGSLLFDSSWTGPGADTLATEFLDISKADAQRLFMPWENDEFNSNGYLASNAEPFSDIAVAARVIRTYLATGEIDWEAAGLQMEEPE